MTIFKDEFDTLFVVMFAVLLFLKVFHWLCQDRVDSMEQSPEIPTSFHVRMVTMIALLVTLDVIMVLHAADSVSTHGPNMMIMFGFEYTLLATNLLASFGKYILHTIDMRREDPWENKSMLLFYTDLVADFVKLVTYLIFFMVILVSYGLPLHIIRDVYMTMRSFVQKCKDLIQYRRATQNMNERYPDASAAELSSLSDPICIICREEMVGQHPVSPSVQGQSPEALNPNQPGASTRPAAAANRTGSNTNVPKKLPCGHIFHFHCLKSWLERQQSCPTCRRLVLDPPTPASTPMPAAPAVDDAGRGGGGGASTGTGTGAAVGSGHGPGHGAGVGTEAGVGTGSRAGAGAGTGSGSGSGSGAGTGTEGVAAGDNNNRGPAMVGHVNQGIGGFPMLYAPQGHYPLGGWYPHLMGGAAGAGAGAAGLAGGGGGGGGHTTSAPNGSTSAIMTEAGIPQAGAGAGFGAVPGNVHDAGALPWTYGNTVPRFNVPHVAHPIPGFIPLFPIQAAPLEPAVVPGAVPGAVPEAVPEAVPRTAEAPVAPTSHIGSTATTSNVRADEAKSSSRGARPTQSTTSPLLGESGTSAKGAGFSINHISDTSLEALTEDQLRYLEQHTRRGLQERLRILQAVEGQIVESMTLLTQALGALPPVTSASSIETPHVPVSDSTLGYDQEPVLSGEIPSPEIADSDPPEGKAGSRDPRDRLCGNQVFGSGLARASMASAAVGLHTLTREQATHRSTIVPSPSPLQDDADPFADGVSGSDAQVEILGQNGVVVEAAGPRTDKGKGKMTELENQPSTSTN
ncbi:E3 ubiquitin-protein ligase hrd1 [Podila epigama]|nr:E3 ubiquitin-protein ligase hrd1 [Podila epigama]